jgi:hypothetical protein
MMLQYHIYFCDNGTIFCYKVFGKVLVDVSIEINMMSFDDIVLLLQ